jgi:hypothetical protein
MLTTGGGWPGSIVTVTLNVPVPALPGLLLLLSSSFLQATIR